VLVHEVARRSPAHWLASAGNSGGGSVDVDRGMGGSPRVRRGGYPGVLDADGHAHFVEQRAASFRLPSV